MFAPFFTRERCEAHRGRDAVPFGGIGGVQIDFSTRSNLFQHFYSAKNFEVETRKKEKMFRAMYAKTVVP
jgi:hypothetical protein